MFEKHQEHIKFVESDPEFIEALSDLPEYSESTTEQYQDLAVKFAIYIDELLYIKASNVMSDYKKSYVVVPTKNRAGAVVVIIDPQATKQEFIDSWTEIKRVRESLDVEPTKRKPKEKSELVYSVFKARRNGESFKAIFDKYKSRKLVHYTGSNKQFDTHEELKWYYSKHRPDKLFQ